MGKFNVGDYVMAIDDAIEGEIVAIKNTLCTLLSKDGFEVTYFENELVLDQSKKDRLDFTSNFSKLASENTTFKKKSKQPLIKKKERAVAVMEVDLHIHKLIKNQKGLSNHDMLTIQIDTAKRQLEFALKKRIPQVVFIHGVGQGVLRAELEYLFRQYDTIRYEDGDYKKYGLGAVKIYFMQNPNR